tara:strand:- start:999 stop:1544 length:546 start_codon:yes stop_codon:yes gene_type:complete
MKSSYRLNSYNDIFKSLCELYKPKSILEIGILDGFSLKSFVESVPVETDIVAIDLFEMYKFRNSEKNKIEKKFKKNKNVTILQGDFYEFYKVSSNFDLVHIDISNDGDIYEFAIKNYFPITNKALILEGGSQERDTVDWMVKYDKREINPFLKQISHAYSIEIIKKFPSLTIIDVLQSKVT